MPIDPKQAALTAINEAIRALDYDSIGVLETDDLTVEALETLVVARELLTDKPWPDLPLPSEDAAAFEAWIAARTAEQIADGRQ